MIPVMIDDLKQKIILKLAEYGKEGCSVNELFRKLKCNKNALVEAKNELIDNGTIIVRKEGKQKTLLCLNYDFFSNSEGAFRSILKRHENHADKALKTLRKLKPLFKKAKRNGSLSGVRVSNQKVTIAIDSIIAILESISYYIIVFTLRYHVDPHAKRFNLTKNQNAGFKMIQKIIEKLILQHRNEEDKLRDYLLWNTTSMLSYVY